MALIETIAALAFVYALLSVIASAFKEMMEAYVQKRKTDLKAAIADLLGDDGAEALFKTSVMRNVTSAKAGTETPETSNPIIRFSRRIFEKIKPGKNADWPAYMDPDMFVKAVSMLASDAGIGEQFRASPLGQSLGAIDAAATERIEQIKSLYTQRMERVQGSFKRNAQWWLFVIGLVLAAAFDADTLHMARQLGTDSTARAAVLALADKGSSADFIKANCSSNVTGKPGAGDAALVARSEAQALIACLGDSLPGVLGLSESRKNKIWTTSPDLGVAFLALLGYLLTAIAISLGAPFWFDLLGKVSNLRATLKPVAK